MHLPDRRIGEIERKGSIVEWKNLIQKAGPLRLGIVILCGVLLLVISCADFGAGDAGEGADGGGDAGTVAKEEEDDNLRLYRQQMEKELTELLEQVSGVGRAEVMITVRASNEKVTLKDNTSKENSLEEETVLIEDSDKNSAPYVVQEREPELEGVVVVCEGGDNAAVKREITDAVSALFQIESHKIKIMKSKEAKE